MMSKLSSGSSLPDRVSDNEKLIICLDLDGTLIPGKYLDNIPDGGSSYAALQADGVYDVYGDPEGILGEYLPSLALWPESSPLYTQPGCTLSPPIVEIIKYYIDKAIQSVVSVDRERRLLMQACRPRFIKLLSGQGSGTRLFNSLTDIIEQYDVVKDRIGQRIPLQCKDLQSKMSKTVQNSATLMRDYLNMKNGDWLANSERLLSALFDYNASHSNIEYCVISNTQLPLATVRSAICNFSLPLDRLYCGNCEAIGKQGAFSWFLADLCTRSGIESSLTTARVPDYTARHVALGPEGCNKNCGQHLPLTAQIPVHSFFKKSDTFITLPRLRYTRPLFGFDVYSYKDPHCLTVRLNATMEDMLPYKLVPALSIPAGYRAIFVGDGTEEASVAASMGSQYIRIRNDSDIAAFTDAIEDLTL